MRSVLKVTPVALALLGLAVAPAFGQERAGEITSVAGEAAVMRDSAVLSLEVGAEIYESDVLITGAGGSLTADFPQCTRSLVPLQALAIEGNPCTAPLETVGGGSPYAAAVGYGGGGGGGGAGLALAGLAGVAAVAAVAGGDDSSSP